MAIGASKPEEPVYETQIETQITAQPQAYTTVDAPEGTSSGNEKVAAPRGYIALRIVQLVVAVIAIGLTSYLIANDYGVSFSAESLTMFVAVVTILAEIYYLIAETIAQSMHNYIAILTFDSLLAIFWLSAMSDSASLRSAFNIPVSDIIYYKKRSLTTNVNTYLDILTTDVVIAALEFVLFVTSLIMFGLAVHRHQKGGNTTAVNPTPAVIETGYQQPVAQPIA